MILDASTYEQVAAVDRIIARRRRASAARTAQDGALRLGIRDQHRRLRLDRRGRRRAAGAPPSRGGRGRPRRARDRSGRHPPVREAGGPADRQGGALRRLRRATAALSVRRQGVQGLHVHVGMPSAEDCWRCLEAILPWLPVVLALSANSPWYSGELTGMASNRAPVLAELPRAGGPPGFATYGEWEAWVERLVALGVTQDYTRIWWDVRPHPALGTLEVRIPDQPTDVRLSAAFAALLQAHVRDRARRRPAEQPCAARRPRPRRLRAEPLGGRSLQARERSCCTRPATASGARRASAPS